jgi:hypothetical protein
MQKFFYQLREDDRRIARKWSIATLGFCASIIPGFFLYAALHSNPTEYASAGKVSQTQVAVTER